MRYLVFILIVACISFQAVAQPTKEQVKTPTNLEWVEKDGKYGLYNFRTKKFKIEPTYDAAEFYGEEISMVKKDGKYGIITHEGENFGMVYDTTINFSNQIIVAKYKGKFQLLQKDNFSNDGMAFAATNKTKDYDQVIVSYTDDFAVVELDGKFGYINEYGEEVIPLKYNGATLFDDGVATVKKKEKWGAIDKANELVIPFQYKTMSGYSNGGAIAQNRRGSWGMVDKEGIVIIEFKYQFLTVTNTEGVALAKYKGKFGIINKLGNTVVPFKYDFQTQYSGLMHICQGYIWLIKDGKWGTVDFEGNTIIPFIYDDLYSSDGDVARVYLGDKMQIVDKEGKCLENCE